MKEGHRSIGVVCHELAMEAENEALMTLYTPGWTAGTVKDLIETLMKRSVAVIVVVNDWKKQPEHLKDALMRIKSRSPSQIRIYDFKTADQCILHAKVFVVDGKKAVIGSSNLSWSGVYSNYEIAVLLDGRDAEKVAQLLQVVIRSPLCKEIAVPNKAE
jgi:phosphatidylserine/phosphatidylglycerophosphate/cardiolipin synthase-like enzyme